MIKPIIPYLGGKIKMAQEINSLVSMSNARCVVDVFGGGGSILLNIHRPKSKIFNDLDSDIVNLFRILQNKDNVNELKEFFKYSIVSREVFEEFKNMDTSKIDSLERAKRTIYLWKCAFSGRRHSDKSFSFGYSKARRVTQLFNVVSSLDDMYKQVQGWYIENLDYKTIFDKYVSKDTIFIIDPPYYMENKNTKYYKHNMDTKNSQLNLFNRVNDLAKTAKFVLTYPNTNFYRNLYKDKYKILPSGKNYSTHNWGNNAGVDLVNTNELIITNI